MYKYTIYFKYKGEGHLPWNAEILTDEDINLRLIPNNGGVSFCGVWINTSEVIMIKKIKVTEV